MFLARMDEGSAGFTMASIDLSEAVNKVAAPFKSVAVSGGKRLSTSIATGVRTHADAAAVAQVVELLLDNATRYASEGSVIELSLCAVSHGKGKGAAELVVSNAVDELPEGDLDRLFDRFYRADASRSSKTGGSGVGLSVVRAIAEAHGGAAMAWMTPNMEMSTSGGGIGKMFSKAFSGEALFQNIWTARGDGMIAFGSCFPGRIVPIEIGPGKSWILQKRSFLAAESGVELSIHFNKKAKAGVFGGEGFIMQKLTGSGVAFAEIDGDLVEYELAAGQQMIVDTGNVAGFEETVSIDAQMVKGVKNIMFGGEGVFNTVLTGPGRIWLQTMPISNLAAAVASMTNNNN